jgi:hypothetical protein
VRKPRTTTRLLLGERRPRDPQKEATEGSDAIRGRKRLGVMPGRAMPGLCLYQAKRGAKRGRDPARGGQVFPRKRGVMVGRRDDDCVDSGGDVNVNVSGVFAPAESSRLGLGRLGRKDQLIFAQMDRAESPLFTGTAPFRVELALPSPRAAVLREQLLARAFPDLLQTPPRSGTRASARACELKVCPQMAGRAFTCPVVFRGPSPGLFFWGPGPKRACDPDFRSCPQGPSRPDDKWSSGLSRSRGFAGPFPANLRA